jgi:hypothetical protein
MERPVQGGGKIWVLSVIAVLALAASFLAGVAWREILFYRRGIKDDREVLAAVLRTRPEYGSLQIDDDSGGYAYLEGLLPSKGDYLRLKEDVVNAFGNRLLDRRLASVKTEH